MNDRPVMPVVTEYLFRKATMAGVPLSGTFELTPVCNMNCRMCYVRMSKAQQEAVRPLRSGREWLELAEQARQQGMLYLLVTGGEPFLHPEIRQILEGLHQMGILVSVNTNGTLISEETVAWLKDAPPMRVNITLYGACNETYHRLCGNPLGFTQTDRAIQMLKQAGIPVKLNCSLTPYNCEDLPGIIRYAKENQLIIQVATYMFPPVRRDGQMVGTNDRFTPEQAAYYTAYADYLIYGREAFLEIPDDEPLPTDLDSECAETGDGVRCRAGRSSFWITWEGNLLPCGMLPGGSEKNVFEGDFAELWECVKDETGRIRLPAECAGCRLKDTCRACASMVMTESGSFDKVPCYRCQMTKAMAGQRALLKKRLKEEENGKL